MGNHKWRKMDTHWHRSGLQTTWLFYFRYWSNSFTDFVIAIATHPTLPIALYTDVSYSITERQRYLLSQSLPTFMTVVGCYGSEERVVDCDYQDFRYSSSISSPTTTMDVSISCGSEESSAQASSVAMASLSISVILAVAVIALVAVLIALLVLQRRRKRRDKLVHL